MCVVFSLQTTILGDGEPYVWMRPSSEVYQNTEIPGKEGSLVVDHLLCKQKVSCSIPSPSDRTRRKSSFVGIDKNDKTTFVVASKKAIF